MKLLITLKKVFPFKIIFLNFKTYGLNLRILSMPKYLLNHYQWFREFLSKASETNFWWNYALTLRVFALTWWIVTRLPLWMFDLENYFVKSNVLLHKMLSRRKMTSLLHLLLKVKERAGIWVELNATVANNMGILLAIVARIFVIIIKNKDTLSKSVPRALKIIRSTLFKLG